MLTYMTPLSKLVNQAKELTVVPAASQRNYSLLIFIVQFYFLLSVFNFYYDYFFIRYCYG